MAKLKRPPRKSLRNAHVRKHSVRRRAPPKPPAPEFLSLQEIVAAARRNMSIDLWNHLVGGADSETTLKRNRQALDSLALRQRVLVDVRKIDITTTLLGSTLSSPVFLAPVGGLVGFLNPEQGAIPVARAAVAHANGEGPWHQDSQLGIGAGDEGDRVGRKAGQRTAGLAMLD